MHTYFRLTGRIRSATEEAGAAVEINRALEPGSADDRGRTFDVHRRDQLRRSNAGVRGTFSVPVIAIAPASSAAGLCNVTTDSAQHYRVLSGSSSRSYF